MIGLIAGLLPGILGTVARELRQAQKDRMAEQNSAKRLELDEKIAFLEARKDVLVAEANDNFNKVFRACLAFPFLVFVWKVVIWDKILKLGATDDLGPNMWKLLGVVYGFYFATEITGLITGAIKKKR